MRKLLLLILIFNAVACVRTKRMLHFNQAKKIKPPATEVVKPATEDREIPAEMLYSDSPEVKRALWEFQKTGKAAIIKKTGFTRFPFGEHEPVVYCNPLRLCDIELEPGEKVIDFASGDNLRWNFFVSVSGNEETDGEGPTHHIILTPRELDIATNFLITTDRRTYNLKLVSKETDYYPRVKFYYPEKSLKRIADNYRDILKKNQTKKDSICFPSLALENLYFNYQLKSRKHVSWRPIRVFDNGEKVFVQMPKSQELPVLLVKSSGSNSAEIVNYRSKCNYLIVDKIFEEAILVSGEGRSKKEVLITRHASRE